MCVLGGHLLHIVVVDGVRVRGGRDPHDRHEALGDVGQEGRKAVEHLGGARVLAGVCE